VGLTYSDDALMTRVFAPPRGNMPLAPRAGLAGLDPLVQEMHAFVALHLATSL